MRIKLIIRPMCLAGSIAGTMCAIALIAGVLAPPVWATPPAPAPLYGGIEIGSKGIKAVAVPIGASGTPDLANFIPKLPHQAVNNVTLVDRLPDGSYRPEAIAEARAAVADYYKHFTQELKIPAERIWIVAGSGLIQKGTPKNQDVLVKAVADATGGAKLLQQIDQETEVGLLIRGAIPRDDWGDAILIDIGSGNVKCGYHHPKRGLHVARNYVVPIMIEGTVSYTKTIQAEMAKDDARGFAAFCVAAARLRQAAVVDKIVDEINRKPGLMNRPRVFLSGGAPWAIATLTNPVGAIKTDELLVPVKLEALQRFRDDFRLTGRIPRVDLSQQPESVQRQAEVQIREVLDTFTAENLMAGSEILLGFADVLKWQETSKEVFFTRSGVVAWIMGFINPVE